MKSSCLHAGQRYISNKEKHNHDNSPARKRISRCAGTKGGESILNLTVHAESLDGSETFAFRETAVYLILEDSKSLTTKCIQTSLILSQTSVLNTCYVKN